MKSRVGIARFVWRSLGLGLGASVLSLYLLPQVAHAICGRSDRGSGTDPEWSKHGQVQTLPPRGPDCAPTQLAGVDGALALVPGPCESLQQVRSDAALRGKAIPTSGPATRFVL